MSIYKGPETRRSELRRMTDTRPEVGDLVEGFDFRRLIKWAKVQEESEELHGSTFFRGVLINGNKASIGRVNPANNDEDSTRVGHDEMGIVERHGRTTFLFAVEGRAEVTVHTYWPYYRLKRGSQRPPTHCLEPRGGMPVEFANLRNPGQDYLEIKCSEGHDDQLWIVAVGQDYMQDRGAIEPVAQNPAPPEV